jgi:hypothetical protein
MQLDFQRKPPPSATGWLLLVVGIATAGALGHLQYDLARQHADQAVRLARLQSAGAVNAAR